MTEESFSFTTTYEGDTDTYFAQRIGDEYVVTVKYKNCEATVEFSLQEVAEQLDSGEWKVV